MCLPIIKNSLNTIHLHFFLSAFFKLYIKLLFYLSIFFKVTKLFFMILNKNEIYIQRKVLQIVRLYIALYLYL